MLRTAGISLLALFGSALLALSGRGSPPAVAHLALAVGILPLILAAMIHFVPVLTRSGDPAPAIARLPHLAQGVGVFVVLALQGVVPYGLVHAAAAVDLVLAAILLRWIVGRSRATLGTPHPGWRWYGAALASALLALSAILLQPLWPAYWPAFKLFHLHLNTLGLVGLAALGTLPVLLPTAVGQGDPDAAVWLRRRLWPAAGGALLVALGCALAWPLALAGVALMLVVVVGLLGQWRRRFGLRRLLADGVTASLLAAVVGLLLNLAAGALHGAGVLPARPTLLAWAAGFLLPLVTGALSQLLPVWRWPGPQIPARAIMRERLAAGGHWRALAFPLAAVCLLAGQAGLGGAFVALGLLRFVFDLSRAVRVTRSTR